MKKKILSFVLCGVMIFAAGCGGNSATQQNTAAPATAENTPAASATAAANAGSGPKNDGVYRLLYASEYTTLNYLITGNSWEQRAAANVIDGLIEHDQYGVVVPSLAESWTSNADHTVWTFKLRQGVKWVDKTGKEVADVTAQDWVDTAKYVNDAHNDSALQYMYDGIVKNASEYYSQTANVLDAENAVTDGKAASVDDYYKANDIDPASFITFDQVGVKALDPYTLEYTMANPVPYFISVLSYTSYLPVYGKFLEEQGENFGIDNDSLLYNGAYVMSDYEPNVKHVFTANPTYWDKGKVYIKEFQHIYNADEATLGPVMFQRGEVSQAYLGADILDTWLSNPDTKDWVRGNMPVIAYSYFYAFNFEPRFDAQYEPDNWLKAVNNENFRQAIMYGIDRIKALTVQDPYNPKSLLNNTITPFTFAVGAGKDFTQYGALKPFSDGNNFDEAKAKDFRDKAKAELTAAGATFPIKVLMPYNPATTNWDKQCQVVQQQLESLLGSDFIKIIVEAGPSTGFLAGVRRSGKYALMRCNWGADYADPQTWTDPFAEGNSYNFMYTDAKSELDGAPKTSKTQQTQDIVAQYYKLVDEAKAQTTDIAARYDAFAKAEAFLLQHAIVAPFSVDTDGYVASLLDPFSFMFAPYGSDPFKYKGVKLLDKPMNSQAFETGYAAWRDAWAKAQESAAQ